MSKTVSQCIFICSSALLLIVSICKPELFGNTNDFLKNFVGGDLLNFLGVLVTITLASAANLHIELNKMEEKIQKRVFTKTRASIKKSCGWLIALLIIAVVLVLSKQYVLSLPVMLALLHSAAILILLFSVLVLVDLMNTAFAISPSLED